MLQVSAEQLDAFRADPDRVAPFLEIRLESYDEGSDDTDPRWTLDLHKYWDIVGYLIRGSKLTDPTDPIEGGVSIGDEMGYGPARFLTSEQVRQAAQELKKLSWDAISSRFDPNVMDEQEVYLAGYCTADEARTAFHRLVNFYADAASLGNALLLVIT
jgi:hypothetical protein